MEDKVIILNKIENAIDAIREVMRKAGFPSRYIAGLTIRQNTNGYLWKACVLLEKEIEELEKQASEIKLEINDQK